MDNVDINIDRYRFKQDKMDRHKVSQGGRCFNSLTKDLRFKS